MELSVRDHRRSRGRLLGLFFLAMAPLVCSSSFPSSSGNLLQNDSFEAGIGPAATDWQIRMQGDWVAKVDRSRIVRLSTEARTGKQALLIDTTALNPTGTITDDLRTWSRPKYEILVTQKVANVKPGAWYLGKLHLRCPGMAVDEGLEYLVDVKPWPTRGGPVKYHWENIHFWEGRFFLPQSPLADDAYHEYIRLEETYSTTDSIEIGLRIRAPWTGKLLVDDVSLTEVVPDRDMTKEEKLLAMYAARPLRKVRELHPETTIVRDGMATGAILVPDDPIYHALAAKLQARVQQLTGARLPAVTRLAEVPKGHAIVAIGSMLRNDLVARLHFNRYVRADAEAPGPGGYVLWTAAEPYGLETGQNVLVVAGSDTAGDAAAVIAFCELLSADGKALKLPYLHTVFPRRSLKPEDREVPNVYEYKDIFDGFSQYYVDKYLTTGDLEAARLARASILKVRDHWLNNPYFCTHWDRYDVGWAWDMFEESPVFSDEDRRQISNLLLAFLHSRPEETSDWSRMVPRLALNPTWNHQANGLSGAYAMARYFQRFYPGEDGRYAHYLRVCKNAFEQQARSFKPQENAGNYWFSTMQYCLAYYLGEWDKTFFDNGNLRRCAEYFATVCNNKGWQSGFGDAYYCYHGCQPRSVGSPTHWGPPLAFWHYRDGRILWWLQHCKFEGYRNLYHQDVPPVEWTELIGVKKTSLARDLYDQRSALDLWGSGGEETQGPVGDVKYEETFDKICLRENWEPDGQYLLLEGISRGIHHVAANNQICKLSLLGEDLLIGSGYDWEFTRPVRNQCAVVWAKDRKLTDPGLRGTNRYSPYPALERTYPAYAAFETMADLPHTGFTRTAMRNFQGADWHRNVFWLKGAFFALIDEIVAREPGDFDVESNFRTCPKPRKTYPPLTPRVWKLLPNQRGVEQTFQSGVSLHILTDGTAEIEAEDKVPDESITTLIVRQHKRAVLSPGERLTYLNLFCGDRPGMRAGYQLERLSPTEAVVFQDTAPMAYFGCAQTEKSKSVLPVSARMFLLTGETLAVVDGTSADAFLRSDTPISRELTVPAATAKDILAKLARLIRG